MRKLVLTLCLNLGVLPVFAEPPVEAGVQAIAESKSNYLMCKNSNVVRTLRIERVGRSCRTTYTKDGVDAVVGKSGDPGLCREVFEKIRENLEKASWKCKDISQSRVSTSSVEP